MGKEYCNYCWAKGSKGGCICREESRPQHCRKAKIRLAAKKEQTNILNKSKELIGLREFINYVSNRIAYLKIFNFDIPSNEYKYHCILRKRIKQWGEEHAIFYKYLMGEITTEQAMCLYGIYERSFYRIMTNQRKELIAFIEEHERILSEKYPFESMPDIFDSSTKEDV